LISCSMRSAMVNSTITVGHPHALVDAGSGLSLSPDGLMLPGGLPGLQGRDAGQEVLPGLREARGGCRSLLRAMRRQGQSRREVLRRMRRFAAGLSPGSLRFQRCPRFRQHQLRPRAVHGPRGVQPVSGPRTGPPLCGHVTARAAMQPLAVHCVEIVDSAAMRPDRPSAVAPPGWRTVPRRFPRAKPMARPACSELLAILSMPPLVLVIPPMSRQVVPRPAGVLPRRRSSAGRRDDLRSTCPHLTALAHRPSLRRLHAFANRWSRQAQGDESLCMSCSAPVRPGACAPTRRSRAAAVLA
jgi:hypothetical protein